MDLDRPGRPNQATVYVYASSWVGAGASDELADRIASEGWSVVNAPRPLAASAHWIGQVRHGTFYAAGDRDIFGRGWDRDDAWPVLLADPREVVAAVTAFAAGRGWDLTDQPERLTRLIADLGWPPIIDATNHWYDDAERIVDLRHLRTHGIAHDSAEPSDQFMRRGRDQTRSTDPG